MRTLTTILAVAVLIGAGAVAGCSDSATPAKTDGAAAKDTGAAKDGQTIDTSGQTDTSAVVDKGAADKGISADKGIIADKGTNADKGTPDCVNDGDCKVFQDCCTCKAVPLGQNPGICKRACKQDTCDAWFNTPGAYCVGGKCKVGEAAVKSCSVKGDCRLVNDCCTCLAVPAKLSLPTCGIKSCFVSTCVGQGLSRATADCVKGI